MRTKTLPPESEITAVDLSPGMLAKAQARAEKLGLRITCQVMDAEALEFPDDTFDTVISSLSTCTFPDPMAALSEMARVCKPAGRILLLEHGRSSWKLLGRYQDRTAQRHYQAAGCRWNRNRWNLFKRPACPSSAPEATWPASSRPSKPGRRATGRPEISMADVYQIRVKEHLDRCWADWFDGFTISQPGDGTTVLAGWPIKPLCTACSLRYATWT